MPLNIGQMMNCLAVPFIKKKTGAELWAAWAKSAEQALRVGACNDTKKMSAAEANCRGGKMKAAGTSEGARKGWELRDRSNQSDESNARDEKMSFCPACGGQGAHLGSLGRREHFRCRDCGMDYSHESSNAPSFKLDKSKLSPRRDIPVKKGFGEWGPTVADKARQERFWKKNK